jgi:hypothetical protein
VRAGPVVEHLVVVPGDDPRRAPVRGLQVGVALVEAVLDPVAVEGVALHPVLLGYGSVPVPARGPDAVFVDVVAEVEDHVGVLVGEMAVGGVVAVRPRGARGEGQPQGVGAAAGGRGRLGAAGGADLTAGAEAVVVFAARFQALGVDVDGVAVFGAGPRGATAGVPGEPLVLGDLPLDLELGERQPAEGL